MPLFPVVSGISRAAKFLGISSQTRSYLPLGHILLISSAMQPARGGLLVVVSRSRLLRPFHSTPRVYPLSVGRKQLIKVLRVVEGANELVGVLYDDLRSDPTTCHGSGLHVQRRGGAVSWLAGSLEGRTARLFNSSKPSRSGREHSHRRRWRLAPVYSAGPPN